VSIPPAHPTPSGAERRQSPRYKCEGSAEFRQEGSDVRTWGTFTDISLNGCYVEMTATFPVGTLVDLGLEIKGVRAQVKGEVRVVYPFLGMGIAFREVSEENRARLKEMVAWLAVESASPGAGSTELAQEGLTTAASNPAATLQAVLRFFETHASISRQEFHELVRQSHASKK
jgi:PilZ domain